MNNVLLKLVPTEKPFPHTDKSWFFLKHLGRDQSNFDLRWVIGWRKRDNWWGVIAAFPATHESAIDNVIDEMIMAKEAIALLKGQLLNG